MRVIAIDPGDKHVGWAVFDVNYTDVLDKCESTYVHEYTPDEALRNAESDFRYADYVVIEKFVLYPDKAAAQQYSEMETSQLIGALKYIAGRVGCKVVMQPAMIKTPTEAMLKARGIELRAVKEKRGGHAKDAEIQGWHFLLT